MPTFPLFSVKQKAVCPSITIRTRYNYLWVRMSPSKQGWIKICVPARSLADSLWKIVSHRRFKDFGSSPTVNVLVSQVFYFRLWLTTSMNVLKYGPDDPVSKACSSFKFFSWVPLLHVNFQASRAAYQLITYGAGKWCASYPMFSLQVLPQNFTVTIWRVEWTCAPRAQPAGIFPPFHLIRKLEDQESHLVVMLLLHVFLHACPPI